MKNTIINTILFIIGAAIALTALHYSSIYTPLSLESLSEWWFAGALVMMLGGFIPVVHRYKIPFFPDDKVRPFAKTIPRRRIITLAPFIGIILIMFGYLEGADMSHLENEFFYPGIGILFFGMVILTLIYPYFTKEQ